MSKSELSAIVLRSSDTPTRSRKFDRYLALALGLITALAAGCAFLPSLGNDFVDWDDDLNFVQNIHYRGVGWGPLLWAWTTFRVGIYQPLGWMLMEVEYAAGGLDPRVYHLSSVVLHVAVAVALYVLVIALLFRARASLASERLWRVYLVSALATILFAVHPLRVEVVAWASSQKYMPCAFCALMGLLAYLHGHPAGKPSRPAFLASAFALYLAALLFHAVAVMIPVVLLILDVFPLGRLRPDQCFDRVAVRLVREKLPYFIAATASAVVAFVAKMSNSSLSTIEQFGPSARVMQSCYATIFYLVKTAWPTALSAFYPLPHRSDFSGATFVGCLVLVVSLTSVLLIQRNRLPGLTASWLAYLVILTPNSGLVQIGNYLVADRYSYLSTMVFVPVLAHTFLRLMTGSGRKIILGLSFLIALIVAVEGLLTWRLCYTWRTSESLWSHALEAAGDEVAFAHTYLATALAKRGALSEAIDHYQRALRLKPSSASAHNLLGVALEQRGQNSEAVTHYAHAVRLRPDYPDAHNNLGASYTRQGQLDEAVTHFKEAIQLDPEFALAHRNLGIVLSRQGRFDQARTHLFEATRFDPEDSLACFHLGRVLAELGQFDKAISRLREAIRLRPGYAPFRHCLVQVLIERGRIDEAFSQRSEDVRSDPRDPDLRHLYTNLSKRLYSSDPSAMAVPP
jgi:Flp pilus assembly protein TadD